ncbi:MAG: rod shape-determining protein [Candidatus Berkelbacteria bacterium]
MASILSSIYSRFSHDVAIDLGTANTLVYVRGHGVVIREPSVVAINKRTNEILAVGEEAKRMVGRTPAHIVAIRPLVDGVISDFEITEQMLKYFFEKVQKISFTLIPRPRVVIGIPHSVTEVERRAVEEGAINAGAREVYLIEEPIAAAIGARLPIQDASGSMIVDIGGGTTEVAVMSLGGVVASRSLRIAGDELNDDIIQYSRDKFNLLLGERTAEEIKIKIGSAMTRKDRREAPMRGRDLVSGLPKEIIVNDEQIREAIRKSLNTIIESVRVTMEETPPELLSDIMDRGIILSGGGALLDGLAERLAQETQTKVYIADDPLTAVVRGAGLVLEDLDLLSNVLLPKEFNR